MLSSPAMRRQVPALR